MTLALRRSITDTQNYDAFRAPRTVTGATPNDFRFTGQQADAKANRGLYYLRARHYDPNLGRFREDRRPTRNTHPSADAVFAQYTRNYDACTITDSKHLTITVEQPRNIPLTCGC